MLDTQYIDLGPRWEEEDLIIWFWLTINHVSAMPYGVFTPEQYNNKTTTRQMLNLCMPMMPFTPGPTFNICLVVVLLWCENTISLYKN